MKHVRITKIRKLEGATWEYLKDGQFREGQEFEPPKIGEMYWVGGDKIGKFFHTSLVQGIVEGAPDSKMMTIVTLNSEYQIEYI